jgi:hypothetical protein
MWFSTARPSFALCFSFFGRNRKVAAAFVKQKKVRRAIGM